MIFINLLPSFIVLAFGEYIHEYFGVGLSDFGIMNKDAIVFEIVIVISYFFLLGFVYSLRSVSDRYQKKVDNQNRDLAQVNTEVMIQSEELALSNENLIEANHIIEEQNKMLEEMVEEKTSHLKSVNEQLTLQNNELSEFSFTVSHKLKSPVATISGLINLFDRNDMSSENSELVEYIERSCTSMDELFHEILNLRSELNQKYSRFGLAKKFDELVMKLTEGEEVEGLDIKLNDKTINGTLFTNKLKFDSILSHLISNAIKYRSNCREPKVEVTVLEDEHNYYLSVWDNGLGIDLELYREKVFGMFQRFHTHTDGKGLGLYLVKAQAESMGGSATVSSKLNEFTKFDIRFKKSQKVLAEN
ncbi:HAMP domain-containing sensor histidine kinase [Flammeovirgaceae bacterium SG7u.111]|nr:HAMP domain-containing sensor histidine kinase [Flammeovirgaceae bacterium SG7u.132]WPO37588.1 HAMP domain-containing sensor histidine kinase [Flammeovirgaceae bacterium SG7u.111]